jgi:cell division septal protein FtsQ
VARDSSLGKTAELVRKRDRRRRRIQLGGVAFLALVVALAAGYQFWLRDSSLFEIRELEIRGLADETGQREEIVKTIRLAADDMTTLHLEQSDLEDDLGRFPRVESATIDADIPNRAIVTVKLREDGSVFGSGSEALLIATDGTVLGSADQADGGLPTIKNGEPPEGGRLDGTALSQAVVLGAAPAEIKSFVKSSDSGGNGVEVTLSNGLRLRFGDASAIDEKWRAAASVIADPELSGAGYVDLTVPRRPAVGGVEATTEG